MAALHLAAYFGLVGPVSSLIERGQPVNSRDENGNTALSWAARNGHVKLVEKLLREPQIDINSKDKEGCGPLSWAVQNGHTEIVQKLLIEKAPADDRDKTRHTPLSLAALHGRADAAEALLKTKRVNFDSLHRDMRTPLAYAAEKGHLMVVETLLKYGSNQNIADGIYKRTPVFRAAWNGHRDVVQKLVEKGNCLINHHDAYGWTPLALAVAGGRTEVVEYLLDTSTIKNPVVDPELKTLDNKTPLQIAVDRRRVRVVQLLLDKPQIKLGPLDQYGSTSPSDSGSVPDEQETRILQMLRARCSQDGVLLPDDFHLHPATNLESLIYCNVGRHQIPNADVHYHCDVCENGNFDVCQTCAGRATCCINESHKLIKRYVVDGNVVGVDT
jgi:ankyrin repeat protein